MMAASHAGIGLGIVMFSGVLTASFPIPMKFSRAWKWENTWLVYATLALVVIPVLLAEWAVPHVFSFYASLPAGDLVLPLLFGFGWGIAQVTFGLSIACVGMAMSFAIVIGMSALLGSVIPLAVFHPAALGSRTGAIFAVSAVLLVCGLVFYGRAGREREASSVAAGVTNSQFVKGLFLCVFTGFFGAMLNIGFVFGGKIADQAMLRGISAERATLSVWAVVLAAGYIPNLAYTLYLLRKNRSTGAFRKSLMREGLLALAAAVFWLFGMLGYGMGAAAMGTYGNSIGFAVCMTVLLMWSSALGLVSGEWRGTQLRTRMRMGAGLAFIAASMVALGIDSLLH
jgi:L-rhamnose-H+ transport protein